MIEERVARMVVKRRQLVLAHGRPRRMRHQCVIARELAAVDLARVEKPALESVLLLVNGRLERSSAAWLWTNVLAGPGQLAPGDDPTLFMPSVPLDLVLRMTGLDGTRFTLGDGRAVTIQLPGAR